MKIVKALFLSIVTIISFSQLYARPIKIKLGTFVPDSIFLVKDFKKMASELTKKSKGKVKMKIYAGGVVGDEVTMVRKLNVGQLHAATFTVIGLSELVPDMFVFNTPTLFNDEAEVQYVLEKMRPMLEKKFEARGYVVVQWASLGWVYLFSKEKVTRPADLEKLKLFVGTPEGSIIYQKAGFTTVDIDTTETLMGLMNNMISAYNTTPLYSLANQWFGAAPHMMDLPWSPATAATVINKKVWNKLSKEMKEFFLSKSLEIAERAELKIKEFGESARKVMKEKGLKVHSVSAKNKKEWLTRFSKIYCKMREKASAKSFDTAVNLINEYRIKKSKKVELVEIYNCK